MDGWKEYTGKSTNEALTNALIEFETTSDQVVWEVLEHESSGLLGFFRKDAKIRVRRKTEEEKNPMKKPEASKPAEKPAVQKTPVKPAVSGSMTAAKPEAAVRSEAAAKPDSAVKPAAAKAEAGKQDAGKTDTPKSAEKRTTDGRQNAVKADNAPKADGKPQGKTPEQKTFAKQDKPQGKKPAARTENGKPDAVKPAAENKADQNKADQGKAGAGRTGETAEVRRPQKEEKPPVYEDLPADEPSFEFLRKVLGAMGLPTDVSGRLDTANEIMEIQIAGEDMGLLIGKRGQTLDSLQYLTSLVVNKNRSGYIKVKLDTENYRERRKQTLENLAKNISFKVKRTKHAVSLEPMNPYERRIIHAALQNDRFVETHSEGEEPYRCVVVTLKKEFMDYDFDSEGRRGRYSRGGSRYGHGSGSSRSGRDSRDGRGYGRDKDYGSRDYGRDRDTARDASAKEDDQNPKDSRDSRPTRDSHGYGSYRARRDTKEGTGRDAVREPRYAKKPVRRSFESVFPEAGKPSYDSISDQLNIEMPKNDSNNEE